MIIFVCFFNTMRRKRGDETMSKWTFNTKLTLFHLFGRKNGIVFMILQLHEFKLW